MGLTQEVISGDEWVRAAFAYAAVGLLVVDQEGKILYANDTYCRLVGRASEELMGLPVWSLMVPDDGLLSREALAGLAKKGSGSYTAHRRYRRRDGHIVWARGTVSVAPREGSNDPVLVISVEDDTERVRLEREFEFQASLLDQVRNAVIATDCDGRITHWNRHAETIYGWTRGEAIGRSIHEVNTPEAAREESERILKAVAESGHWEGEFVARRKNGSAVPIYATLSAIRGEHGRLEGFVGVSNDITEWNQVQQEARTNQTRLTLAVEAGQLGTWELDLNTCETVRSRRHDEIFGYERPVTPWGSKTFFEHLHAEDRERIRELIHKSLHEKGECEFECRIVRADGQPAWIWSRSILQNDAEGRKARVTGVVRDITYRKLQQQQMEETQKLESLGILAGGIAHDFNNLLAGVIGNASMAESTVPENHAARKYLTELVNAGERAAHLTQQMLAYAGKGRFVLESIDLNELVREMSSLMHGSIPNKVSLLLELAPDMPTIEGDQGQMQQIIMNLLLNAAEAVPPDSEGTVTIRTGMAEERSGEPHVFVEVQDTGIGMDEETRSKIFDPFFTTKFLGRGLGLAAVHGAVRGHRGEISVRSELGRGTTFRVVLPASGKPAGPPVARPIPTQLGHSGTILLVEDEEVVRKTTSAMLKKLGYSVVTARNGREGVEKFARAKGNFELVVLDMKMPVMGGEEALPELRKVRPDVPIVLTSGFSEMEAVRVFGGPLFDGFLQKPFRPAALADAVRCAMGKQPVEERDVSEAGTGVSPKY